MKSTIIEGIPDSKIKRLKKHLLKTEKIMGGELRQSYRFALRDCPVMNFCSSYHAFVMAPLFSFYNGGDTHWWKGLPFTTRYAITRHIQQWIKEGKKL